MDQMPGWSQERELALMAALVAAVATAVDPAAIMWVIKPVTAVTAAMVVTQLLT